MRSLLQGRNRARGPLLLLSPVLLFGFKDMRAFAYSPGTSTPAFSYSLYPASRETLNRKSKCSIRRFIGKMPVVIEKRRGPGFPLGHHTV